MKYLSFKAHCVVTNVIHISYIQETTKANKMMQAHGDVIKRRKQNKKIKININSCIPWDLKSLQSLNKYYC